MHCTSPFSTEQVAQGPYEVPLESISPVDFQPVRGSLVEEAGGPDHDTNSEPAESSMRTYSL